MIRLRRLRINDFKQLREIDLALPPRGTFLVQGMNEAGKSTLFEAIFVALFGRPLEARSLDECVRYGSEESWIELEVELPNSRRLRVTRRLRIDKANVWGLELIGATGEVEEVRGNAVVNARVEAELGFDGEALLNTCFVEQKKLSKLEGMSRRQRETSLMKLLNLDRMIELGDELKVGRDEEHRLERLRARADLARLQALEPAQAAALSEVETALVSARASSALRRAADARRDLDAIEAKLAAAREKEAAIARLAETAERLRVASVRLDEGRREDERAVEMERAAASAAALAAAARSAAAETVPAITRRGTVLRRIADRLAFIDRLDAERDAAERWADAAGVQLERLSRMREDLNRTRRELVEARGAERDAINAEADLAQAVRAFEVRSALSEWVEARVGLAGLGDPEPRIQAVRAERERVRRRISLEAGSLVAVATAIGIAGWLLPAIPIGLAVVLAVLALVLAAGRSYGAARRLGALGAEIGRLEGEASVLHDRRRHLAGRATESAARIEALNAGIPGSPERAHEALVELDQRLAGRSTGEVSLSLEATRQARADATAQIRSLEAREAELRDSAGPVDAEALGVERKKKTGWADRVAKLIKRQRQRLADSAAAHGAELSGSFIERELGSLRSDLRTARDLSDRLPELEREQASAAAAAAEATRAAVACWRALPTEVVGELKIHAALPSAALSSAALPDADLSDAALPGALEWDAAEARIRAAYESAGGDAVRAAHREATTLAADLAGRRAAAWEAANKLLAAAHDLIDVVSDARTGIEIAIPVNSEARTGSEIAIGENANADALVAAADAFAQRAGAGEAQLVAERDRRAEAIALTRHDRARLEDRLDLRGERLDAPTCERERDEFDRELRVRSSAARIIDRAGKNVVVRIMPSTIQHMRHLLPTLTDGRYFDAQLSEDYQMEVYDDRARDWRRKTLFSGGAQDQMSLALRLAFALATLPEERGAAPSFLFLDEPLGAFDSERSRALIDLITDGEIADSFDQIFLISHVRVDPERFDHRIVLDDGRVVETDLDSGAEVGPVIEESVEEV